MNEPSSRLDQTSSSDGAFLLVLKISFEVSGTGSGGFACFQRDEFLLIEFGEMLIECLHPVLIPPFFHLILNASSFLGVFDAVLDRLSLTHDLRGNHPALAVSSG